MHADPLSSSDWQALDAAFDRALDLEGSERERFIDGLDPALAARLRTILADGLESDPFLDHPRQVLDSLAHEPSTPSGGDTIGRYELLDLVGEGGMGRVYRARRADGAFDQTVALKVVRSTLSLAGADVADRLRRERAVLAALDHPAIARLLDGGETDDGVPYLVTEFVDGAPLTDWADAHHLGVPERVRLMVDVARAVDHAHRRFVIHRDLKPSNVLVTERDGVPRPVVLDFGIAKLLAEAEGAETDGGTGVSGTAGGGTGSGGTAGFPLTRTGLRLLTPAYAAPELFEPVADVTTAVDVYGLGALLYELLTGRRPHDRLDGRPDGAVAPPTMEPVRPSKAVTQPVTRRAAEPATQRVAEPAAEALFDPAHRARLLRGDLDTICLKALHHDPGRRYGSAAAFAADLERHLEGRPVEARPDSVAYIVGRYARRHRAAVLAAAVAVLALIGGLGTALVSLGNEREARVEAEAAAARAQEAAQLLGSFFAAANPEPAGGRLVTVREALDQGVARVGAVASDTLRAYLLRILGETYVQIGDPVLADSLLQVSLSLMGEGATGEDATYTRLLLAATRDALDDPETALALGARVVRDHQHDADPDRVAWGLWVVARAHLRLGQPDAAVRAAEQAVQRTQRGATIERRVSVLRLLGETYTAAGRGREAIPTLEEALALASAEYGEESVATAHVRATLAEAKTSVGAYREAEALLRVTLAYQTRVFGENTVAEGYMLSKLAAARFGTGDYRGTAALLDSAITMVEPLLPPMHRDVGTWYTRRAAALNRARAYREAEDAARRAVEIAGAQTEYPEELGDALRQLGLALREQGRNGAARAVFQQALTAFEASEGAREAVAEVRATLASLPAGS